MKTELTPVSRERHSSLTWQRPENYLFAAQDVVVTVASPEIARVMMSMALGFVAVDGGTYFPVAVQGLKQGQNKFVGSDGRWLGDYVPAAYRVHPFKLARSQDQAEVLCVDEAAGRVSTGSNGEPFFMPDGTPAAAVAEAFKLLIEVERDRPRMVKTCEILAQHGLIEPWPLKAQEGEQLLEAKGLYRIAEGQLYALEPAALAEVRNSGGLMLAFAQLFSMQQLQKLGKLGASSSGPPPGQGAAKLFEENGIISFANL